MKLPMTSNQEEVEIYYSTEKLAQIIGIKEPTVRKYLTALAKQSYEFELKADGSRKLRDQELQILQKIVELKSKPNTTIEDAITTVVLAHRKGYAIDDISQSASVSTEQMMDILQKIYQRIELQDEKIDLLTKELHETKTALLESKQLNQKLLTFEEEKKEIEQERNAIMETWKSQQSNWVSEVNTKIENTITESFRRTRTEEQQLAKRKGWLQRLLGK